MPIVGGEIKSERIQYGMCGVNICAQGQKYFWKVTGEGSVADPQKKKKMRMRIRKKILMRIRIHVLTELWRTK
jgi:hypothetical protein